MSTFEADEQLQARCLLPRVPRLCQMGVLELVGGFLILIGLFTRPVAFILAGDMAVAYFMAHAPKSFFPTINGGQLAILFCFVFLYLVFAGGGAWDADEQLERSHKR